MRERAGTVLHVVLLAGGGGTRFWPHSRKARPKQFLALVDREPLLAATWRRALRLVPRERIWVVVPRPLAAGVRALLPDLAADRLILEPSPRDTAPAVALACATIEKRVPGAIVGIFPTDHHVRDVAAFAATVRRAAQTAAGGALVCLGVRPDRPATGFGYLRVAARPRRGPGALEVERFVEKPSAARARAYLRSGRYYWNAGMFVWRAARFLAELERRAPGVARAVEGHLGGRRGAWERGPRVSVDYAVMERARGVALVPLNAGWDDLGSWDAAARLRRDERSGPEPIAIDSPGSAVFSERRQVALVGVPGVIVVDAPDALLVVARDSAERVREVVRQLDRRRAGGRG